MSIFYIKSILNNIFSLSITKRANKLERLSPDKSFPPDNKAGAYPSGCLLTLSTNTRLAWKNLSGDKRSSLFCLFVSDK